MTVAICTLFEGDYHYGLGALVNSLVRNGFRGQVIAGYRGALPPWCSQLKRVREADSHFEVVGGCELVFIPVEANVHFTHYKPRFAIDVLSSHAPDVDALFYFDPDIVIRCRWGFFEEWVRDGVALCEDVNWRMPNDHPIRNTWRTLFATKGISLPNRRDAYYNAGFVGVTLEQASFWHDWVEILQHAEYDRTGILTQQDRTYPFRTGDQDCLNITAMKTRVPLSTVGPQGMGFSGARRSFMNHAIGPNKPWRTSSAWASIRHGRRLDSATRAHIEFADRPIRIYSKPAYARRIVDLWIAATLSRFFP